MPATPRTPRAVEQRRAIGRRLRALRLALCLTVKQAKDAIGTGKAQLQAIETGNADVMASTLIDIAEVYGLHVAVVAGITCRCSTSPPTRSPAWSLLPSAG